MRRTRRVIGVADRDKVAFAREQRREPTRAEDLLWHALRRRQLGMRFRRQHPIDDFVLDLYCGEAQLAVEVDGPVHAEQEGYDHYRDECLQSRGIRVLRVPEARVREDLPGVLRAIREALEESP